MTYSSHYGDDVVGKSMLHVPLPGAAGVQALLLAPNDEERRGSCVCVRIVEVE